MTLAHDYIDEVPLQQTLIGSVDSFETVCEFMRWLSASRGRDILAVDCESTGLDGWAPDARIRLVQFGTVNEAWVINAEKYPGLCQEVLETYRDTEFVFHNGLGFDFRYMSVVWPDLKLPWSVTHDTMIAHRIHDNEATAALKPVSERLFGKIATAGQRALEDGMAANKWTWATVPMDFPAYGTYSAMDVILTARLHRRMAHVHSGEFKAVYDLERDVRRICTEMEVRGMKIDTAYCAEKKRELDDYIEKTKEFCLRKFGVQIGSTMQLGKWFEDRGVPLTARTATGLPKMGKDELDVVAALCRDRDDADALELATYALKTRKADKISGTYLANFLSSCDSNDVIHAQLNPLEARTGRMSITSPALQTLPRDDAMVRPSVIPFDGHVLLSADSDQIEFRCISALSGDQNLVERFAQADSVGPDIFTQITREIFDAPDALKSDPRRAISKSYTYSSLYGAGIAKQALTAGISFDRMKKIAGDFAAAYPGLDAYKSAVIGELEKMKRAGERPYVLTDIGRRLYIDPDRTYAGVNYKIQSTCADVLKQSLVNLDRCGLGEMMIIPIHDEVLFSVDPAVEDVYDIKMVINQCMSNYDYDIPLPASCGPSMMRWVKQ